MPAPDLVRRVLVASAAAGVTALILGVVLTVLGWWALTSWPYELTNTRHL